ncbi:MAG: hypothetical protein WCJ36_01000 [Candidatus Saccharibacteria bacterium]
MDVFIVYVVVAIVLFMGSFATKRRFGLLGLAIAAGSLLSSIWSYGVELMISGVGFPSGPLTTAIVQSIIIILPAGVLLFHGYTYKTLFGRAIGAGLFAILATAFLVEPLGHVLMPHGLGTNIYNWLVNNRDMIIGVGLTLAVFDLFTTKPVQLADKKR